MVNCRVDRRSFIKLASAAGFGASMHAMPNQLAAQEYQPTWDSIDKRPTPKWFTNDKFGIFIHWGVYSVPSYAPVIPGKLAYAEWYWHRWWRVRSPKANASEKRNLGDPPKLVWRRFSLCELRAHVPGRTFRSRATGRTSWRALAPNMSP